MPGEAEVIIAAISAGERLVSWIGGVIERHKAGQDVTTDEAAKILAAEQVLLGSEADADAADARLKEQLGEKGLQV